MASQLNLEHARALQRASRKLIGLTKQRNKLLQRDIDHRTPSKEHSAFVNKVSAYPNSEELPTFTPITGRASGDSDTRGMYWVLATKSLVLMHTQQTINLYLTDQGELAVDRGYAETGEALAPSIQKAKNTTYIADNFSVADLKQARNTLERFEAWLARTNDDLHDAWRKDNPSPLLRALTALSLSPK